MPNVSKIIGFTISPHSVKTREFDADNGINTIEINDIFNIRLWGIGSMEIYRSRNKLSLAFPENFDLLDRNVVITIEKNRIMIENDWLGAIPVFYNPKERIVSTRCLDCLVDKAIDTQGLKDYFNFGYSVFESTPFHDTKFLRYCSTLILTEERIDVAYRTDPVEDWYKTKELTSPDEVIGKIKNCINQFEQKTQGTIIIPTSGGLDSRLLNWCIDDRPRIRSFTYGVSRKQSMSHEVVLAKSVAEKLNISWQQLEIRNCNRLIPRWFERFGFSTHLHGMYQDEFYEELTKHCDTENATVLSGIVGDIWAGNINTIDFSKRHAITELGYSHGMSYPFLGISDEKHENFFGDMYRHIGNTKIQAIFRIRIKIILLSYLTTLPEYRNISSWTPFLNFDIATSILSIPDQHWAGRKWQYNFFANHDLGAENKIASYTRANVLDRTMANKFDFAPLDEKLLSEFIPRAKIEKINAELKRVGIRAKLSNMAHSSAYATTALRRLGIGDPYLSALYQYYLLKPIELSIQYDR